MAARKRSRAVADNVKRHRNPKPMCHRVGAAHTSPLLVHRVPKFFAEPHIVANEAQHQESCAAGFLLRCQFAVIDLQRLSGVKLAYAKQGWDRERQWHRQCALPDFEHLSLHLIGATNQGAYLLAFASSSRETVFNS